MSVGVVVVVLLPFSTVNSAKVLIKTTDQQNCDQFHSGKPRVYMNRVRLISFALLQPAMSGGGDDRTFPVSNSHASTHASSRNHAQRPEVSQLADKGRDRRGVKRAEAQWPVASGINSPRESRAISSRGHGDRCFSLRSPHVPFFFLLSLSCFLLVCIDWTFPLQSTPSGLVRNPISIVIHSGHASVSHSSPLLDS